MSIAESKKEVEPKKHVEPTKTVETTKPVEPTVKVEPNQESLKAIEAQLAETNALIRQLLITLLKNSGLMPHINVIPQIVDGLIQLRLVAVETEDNDLINNLEGRDNEEEQKYAEYQDYAKE